MENITFNLYSDHYQDTITVINTTIGTFLWLLYSTLKVFEVECWSLIFRSLMWFCTLSVHGNLPCRVSISFSHFGHTRKWSNIIIKGFSCCPAEIKKYFTGTEEDERWGEWMRRENSHFHISLHPSLTLLFSLFSCSFMTLPPPPYICWSMILLLSIPLQLCSHIHHFFSSPSFSRTFPSFPFSIPSEDNQSYLITSDGM